MGRPKKALENYRKIAGYYRSLKLNCKDERAVKKYSDIRKKFGMLKEYSNDF